RRPFAPGSGRSAGHQPRRRRPPLGAGPGLAVPAAFPVVVARHRFFRAQAAAVSRTEEGGQSRPDGTQSMPTWDPRANDLFLKALELGSPGERQQYLDGACGADPALRAEVEALLDASARAGSFLEPSPRQVIATVDEPPIRECPGTMIGPYKLLEQIGE